METKPTITNNKKQMQFEIREDDDIAFLAYRFQNDALDLTHTEVPKSMAGKGIGTALAEYAFEYAKEHQHKVIVHCTFISAYVKKHPEVRKQLDTQNHN